MERGFETEDSGKEEFCWLAMVDQPANNHYAAEVDWKAETEDILHNLNFIVVKLRLPIDLDSLGISGALWGAQALREISAALKNKGHTLGQIDIDSDSYVLD